MLVQIRVAKVRSAHGDRLGESPNRDSYIVDRIGIARPDGALDLTGQVLQPGPCLGDCKLPGIVFPIGGC